jgi:hypothetical protein
MKVVFIGCEPFRGTDKCGFQWSFYKKHFKIGDICEVSEHYDDMSDVFNNESSVIHILSSLRDMRYPFRGSFPIEHFISLEKWREMKLNYLGI